MEEQRDVCFLMGSTHHTTGHNVLELLYRPRPPPATAPPPRYGQSSQRMAPQGPRSAESRHPLDYAPRKSERRQRSVSGVLSRLSEVEKLEVSPGKP